MSEDIGFQRWVSFYNDSGSTIPPYALLSFKSDKGASSDVYNYRKRLKAKKYATSDRTNVFAFNSGVAVAAGKYGKCTFPADGPCWARVDPADMDSNAPDISGDIDWSGKVYGPTNGKWSITPTGSGFILLTRPQASGNRVLVVQGNSVEIEGVLDGDLAAAGDVVSGATTAVMLLVRPKTDGSGVVSTQDQVTVTNRDKGFSKKKYDYLRASWVNGEWRPIGGGGSCPATNTWWAICIFGPALGGTFKIGKREISATGYTWSSPIPYNPSESDIRTAVNAVYGVNSAGYIYVSTSGQNIQVEFSGVWTGLAVPGLLVDPGNLIGPAVGATSFLLREGREPS